MSLISIALTPIVHLGAISGLDYKEEISLSDNEGNAVSLVGAVGSFVIREYQRGRVILVLDNVKGVTYEGSSMVVEISELELSLLPFNSMWYECFIQVPGKDKQKLLMGKFLIE